MPPLYIPQPAQSGHSKHLLCGAQKLTSLTRIEAQRSHPNGKYFWDGYVPNSHRETPYRRTIKATEM